jgi:hypothetical protein
MSILEDETLDVQEESGNNSSFGIGAGHHSVLDLAEEEELGAVF